LNASFIFEPGQLLAFRLGLRRNTWRNLRSPSLLDDDGAARIPVEFHVSGEVDLHMHDAVSVLGEKAQDLTPCHQLTCGLENNTEAEVAFVASNFDAEEVKSGMIFSTQWKYTKQSKVLASFLELYFQSEFWSAL
jgi:hypothetical protein